MEKRRRNLEVAFGLAALMLTGGTSAAANADVRIMALRLVNHAGAPPGELALARAYVDNLFAGIAVRIDWLADRPESGDRVCDGGGFLVTLLSTDRLPRWSEKPAREDIAAWASKADARVFVYPDRVRARAARTRGGAGVLLGRVIAHEVGHLLLPPGHSRIGIMAAEADNNPTSLWTRFTPDQARAIRAALGGGAVSPVAAPDCGK